MNWEALDDPAVVVPRVMDVNGTLLRLGFKGHTIRGTNFYRLFVALYRPIAPPVYQRRQISHVEFTALMSDDDTIRVYTTYGYPERYRKKLKIVEGFKKLLSDTTSVSISLYQHDERLRELEKTLALLITNLRAKIVDCTVERDSEYGLVKHNLPEHEALVSAVQQMLCSSRARDEDEWFIYDPGDPAPRERSSRITPINKYSRLPNFDRRLAVRRHVRRPV